MSNPFTFLIVLVIGSALITLIVRVILGLFTKVKGETMPNINKEEIKKEKFIDHQAFICPYCCDDHDSDNTRCKDAFNNGIRKERARIKKDIEKLKEKIGIECKVCREYPTVINLIDELLKSLEEKKEHDN
jgi:hypothetical protein